MTENVDLAAQAVTGVLRAANEGDLPLFAATLGMAPADFAELIHESSRPGIPLYFPPPYDDLLAEWLPESFAPLVDMLWHHCDDNGALDWWVCHAIASACFGRRHLWQDLGLRGRADVSRLLRERFPRLHARNTRHLRWKRFLFAELGRRLGKGELQPPACDGCDERHVCFADRQPRKDADA